MKDSVKISNLSVAYNGNVVLQNISFSVGKGKLVGIIGPNGAGKSTLIKAILGLIPARTGDVQIDGQSIKQVRKDIAYVPQRSDIDWDFPILVQNTVLLGTYPKLGLFRIPLGAERRLASQCLKKVDMQDYSKRQIAELSGGQQQRVFLARALAQEADFLFLDEPFVGIDVASENMIIKILKELRDQGKTIFVVHHDLSKVEQYFDELILLNKELIKSGPVDEVVKPELMTKAYRTDFHFLNKMGVGM